MQLGLQILVNICQKTFLCKIIFVHVCSVELRENNVTLCTMYLPTTIFVWLLTKKKSVSNRNFKYKNQIQGSCLKWKRWRKHQNHGYYAIIGTRNFIITLLFFKIKLEIGGNIFFNDIWWIIFPVYLPCNQG